MLILKSFTTNMGQLYEYRQMLCLSILPRHGKVIHRRTVSTSRAEHHDADIYGSRVGKKQLEKDPIIFQRGPATNNIGNIHTRTHQAIQTDEHSCK